MSGIISLTAIGNGLSANDGTGDTLRSGADKINGNNTAIVAAVNNLAAAIARTSTAKVLPNLFSTDELDISALTHLKVSTGLLTPTPSTSGIYPCWAATGGTDGATIPLRFVFDAALFTTGYIAASIRVMEVSAITADTSVKLNVLQYNTSSTLIQTDSVQICGREAITTPSNFQTPVIAKDPSTTTVYFEILIGGLGGPRTIKFRDMSITAGVPDFALPPISIPSVSLFPDPNLSGVSSTTTQWTPSMEDGEVIISASAGTLVNTWSIPASSRLAAGDTLTFTAELQSDVEDGCDITIISYDGSGGELSRYQSNQKDIGVWQKVSASLLIPVGVGRVDVRVVSRSSSTYSKLRRPMISTTSEWAQVINVPTGAVGDAQTLIFVDSNSGNDANDGVSGAVKTFTRANQLAGANTLMIVGQGDYTDSPQITPSMKHLEVRAVRGARVRLIGGTKITGATLLDGTTKTYSYALATAPSGHFLAVHDVPEIGTLIDAAERLPIQNGRQYRLPFTRIFPVATLAEVDTNPQPAWYWSSGILYFSVPSGADPNGGVYIQPPTASPFNGALTFGNESLRVVGIDTYYWARGFGANNFVSAELIDCRAFGAGTNGFATDDSGYVRMTRCEAGGNGNDGCGGHQTLASTALRGCQYVGDACWYHDNWDDGESFHEGWNATDYGTVVEYNGDRGIVTADGGQSQHFDCHSRKNNQIPLNGPGFTANDGGWGFCAAGTSGDGGIGTQIALWNCISEGNPVNYGAASADNSLVAYNCLSINAGTVHYSVTAPATMRLASCTYSGTGTATSGAPSITNVTAVA